MWVYRAQSMCESLHVHPWVISQAVTCITYCNVEYCSTSFDHAFAFLKAQNFDLSSEKMIICFLTFPYNSQLKTNVILVKFSCICQLILSRKSKSWIIHLSFRKLVFKKVEVMNKSRRDNILTKQINLL